jgi:phosphoglycolate phosphatase-like HAD superfamily hydrolase
MTQRALIVFDIDGVLIDVSKSYTVAVPTTASLFFQAAQGGPLPDPLFPLADLATIQQSGGLNNDWDLTYVVLKLLASRARMGPSPGSSDPWLQYEAAMANCDVTAVADFLSTTRNPLEELFSSGSECNSEFIKTCYTGDVGSGNIIKQIFQEVYLGADIFQQTYNLPPHMHLGEGLNSRETLLISRTQLKSLSVDRMLAVATGRTTLETNYALDSFQIRDYFTSVCDHDDCVAAAQDSGAETEAFLKPSPYMLDRIAAEAPAVESRYYVGDLPDDMLAATASSAKYTGIGLTATSSNPAQLRTRLLQAGAKDVAGTVQELCELLQRA